MAHPVDIHVGKRIRLRRNALNISQQELAEQSGITFQQVQKYEHGVNRVSCSRLYEFANVLGVSIAYFFDGLHYAQAAAAPLMGVADMGQAAYQPGQSSHPQEEKLLSAFRRIHDQGVREHVLALVENLGQEAPAVKQGA